MATVRLRFPRWRLRHLVFCAGLVACTVANPQVFTQQGPKLVGSTGVAAPAQGYSVALSAGGNTALVGGPYDNGNLGSGIGFGSGVGAVWVFTRDSNRNWTQQGNKLIGSGAIGAANQGSSVALSADGNTALVGGPLDNSGIGAVWVFTRDSNGNWNQQGSKLVGAGTGVGFQGYSVALSGDGNTALVGGMNETTNFDYSGAVWVFTRDSNGNWSQQGSRFLGNNDLLGFSLAISADGNTALAGAPYEHGGIGAVWVLTRESGGNWTLQPNPLLGSGGVTGPWLGNSVSLSADGNTALVGGYFDHEGVGAAWVFTRDISGNWSQQGGKLLGGSLGQAENGASVALSGDGSKALIGAPFDTDGAGSVWVFTRDSNGIWSQAGSKLVGSPAGHFYGGRQGWSVALSADGNTALVGGPGDDGAVGAMWVFVRGPSTPFFLNVPGALFQVSVSADGSIWGINSSQQIFTYNSATGGWTNIAGALTQIAVGSSSAVWGLNENQQIYHWDPVHSQWIKVPGSLAQIAVGADGDVWGLNAQSNIYHYNAQTGFFSQVGGQLKQIAVGSAGAVYGINSAGSAFWYNPGTGFFEYLPGPALTQIAVGADGVAVGLSDGIVYGYGAGRWIAGPTNVALEQIAIGTGASIYGLDAAGNIYFYNGPAQSFVQIPGTLSSLAVGGSGAMWGLNSAQEVFTLQNAPTRGYQTLTSIPGSLNQISVGADGSVWGLSGNTVETFNPLPQTFQAVSGAPPLSQLSVGSGGDVWGVDSSGNIFQYNASSQTWNNIPGELNFIEVGADQSVWGINSAGQTYNFSNDGWKNIPGALQTLSVGADGTVWGINAQQQIYRFDTGSRSWVNVPGALVQIAVGNKNNVWGINAQQQVYYYNNARGWVIIPGAYLTDISVAFDGTVWGENAGGNLYQWNASTQSFNFMGSGVTDVSVGNAAAVWALNRNSGAVFSWF